MAGFRKIYTSQNQYLEDVARSTGLFDDDYYNMAKESKKDLEYITLMANAKDNISSTFDKGVYDRLSGEERFNYFAAENFIDKSSQEYKDSQAYFSQRIQQIKNEEIFNSLNDFEKTMNSIGGWFANMTLQLGGLIEGLVDVGALAAGAVGGLFDADFAERIKNFVAEDATGYNAAQQSMNDWINKYTFLDKNIIAKGINDITTGIVRMTPMLLGYAFAVPTGGVSKAIGTTIYYASMAGNTAEEAIKANPDINYGSLLGYTAGTVGLEALTEWASGKIFRGDIISKMAFGGDVVPSGNILRGLLGNFGTEAFEESVSELFGSMMYKHLVDPTANVASVEDILYAAVIGGLTGSLLFGADVALKTKRMSVVDGKLVETKTLTPEQRKTAKNLGLRKSYGLQSMLSQAQETLQQPTNVTKLMTKYGTSLQDIQQNHAEEYTKAVEQDTQTKKNQADGILALANLMQTIGVEQFTKSAKFLEENLAEAEQAIYNFNNHTDVNNKRASEAFKTLYPNETYTPAAIPAKEEQTLATELRKIIPGAMVSFGVFGNPEGLAKASINQGGNFIFIKSGLVAEIGFDAALNEVIKYEIAQDVMRQLPADIANNLAKLALEDDVEYDKLSHDQKLTVAQMICFDPVFNQKTFLGDKKTHIQIYNYLNKELKKTGLPKVKFNNLLKIRNTFLNSIANFVANQEDLDTIQKKYELSDEELQEKIVRFTTITNFNNRMRLADLNLAKQSISKCYAQKELESHIETEGEFDWNRLYDETYYDDDYVSQIKGDNPDFKEALIIHLSNVYNTDFNAISLASMERYVKENMSEQEVRNVANEILTEEFVKNISDLSELQTEVANKMWWLTQLDIAKTDLDVDSIIVTDNQIKGTGKLDFIIGDISDGDILLSGEQRRDASKSTRDLFRRVPSSAAKYTTNTSISNLEFSQQDDATIDDHQKALRDDYKKKTGLNLHFFKDAVVYKGEVREKVQGFVNGTDVYVRYDGTLTNDQLNKVMEHEATHKRRDAEPEKYEALKGKIEQAMTPEAFNELYAKYERLYEPIYGKDDPRIEEEMVINIAVGIEKPSYKPNEEGNVEALIKGFMKTSTKLMKQKISEGVRFSEQTSNETKNIKSSSNATTPKQIADAITSIVANSPMAYSESKGFEGAEMEYTKVAQSMIDENFGLFRKVNQGNYQQIRDNIAKTDAPYTQQALVIFDRALFTYAEDSSRFDEATQEKIKNQARQTQTISAQWQGLQSRRLADKTSLTEIKNKFAEDGYDISISNETVTNYVPEMKNKEKFIKQIDEDIAKIESQIDDAKDSVEKAALNKELKDATEKRMVMDKGTNEEIMDWVITNEDIVNRASKIQKEIFEQMVDKAEKAAETPGKKAITILVDEKTGLPKPFPKATQWIEKNVKRLKSFRMWAMLTSPVSWVRNWVGNAGMTALDGVTNQLEKWMTARLPQIDVAKLEQQAKELNSKKTLTDAEKTKLAEINAQIQRAYDFKFVETTASKELKQQIAKEYESVFQQILNGEDISKYEGSAEKAGAIARAEREITRKSENANFVQKVWAACQSMTDWGLNTGWFGDNAVVLNSLIKNFANMVESNKAYLIKSLTTEYGKDGRGMSAERKALVEKALNTKNSMDIINAMSKSDVELFMDSCKQRTFEQYFKNANWLSKWASNLSQKHPILASLTSLVLPFPKVAANIMTMAYKYSPLGFISALRQWSVVKQMDAAGYEGVRDAFARAKLTRTTAQATVGTVMCIAGLLLASLGFIDIDDDDYLGPALHVGDLRISLSNLAPSMTTFSVGAAMMWAWKNDQSAALKALDVLYDNTLLGNIENVFRYGSPDKYIENLSINYVSQYVPAMLKLFAKFTTNQAMIDKSGSYFEKLGKTFVSGIPFAADLLPKKINPYTGEFLTNTGSQDVFFNFMEAISPLDFKTTTKSKTQKEAERLGTESSGLTGKFKVNDKEYDIDKVTYSKYRATYIQNTFDDIMNGKQKVTVEDENGKRITTTYDKLTDKQKKNVLSRLYTEATNITKIKWWTDQGNKYVVTDRDLYNEYRKQFKNIVYKKTWTKSKFVES